MKPILSEENKVTRVLYCIDEVFPVPDHLGKYYYKNLFDRVDIDEKWFNLSCDKENYIVLDPSYNDSDDDSDDEMPHRRVRNKGYKNKVLFLCAQARPRWDPHRNAYWDGKLGIWPVGSWKPAQRTSIQRAAGTMVWHNETVTRDVYRRLLVQKLLPAIETLWPRGEWANPSVVIRVQQDGPQSHIKPNDTKWNEELQRRGLQNKTAQTSISTILGTSGHFSQATDNSVHRMKQKSSIMWSRHMQSIHQSKSIGSTCL